MEYSLTTVQIIQGMVAPAIMISCCGLLFLGLQNRYGRIVDRLRQFNREKKSLTLSPGQVEILDKQTRQLTFRGKLQRNALSCLLLAITFFVLSSLFIIWGKPAVITFLVGMILVLTGAIFAGIEIIISYRTVLLETFPK